MKSLTESAKAVLLKEAAKTYYMDFTGFSDVEADAKKHNIGYKYMKKDNRQGNDEMQITGDPVKVLAWLKNVFDPGMTMADLEDMEA